MTLASGASASSFVVLEAVKGKTSPSIVVMGEPKSIVKLGSAAPEKQASKTAKADFVVPLAYPLQTDKSTHVVQVSPSVIAFESPEPDVTYEKVAAIPHARPAVQPSRAPTPMVMRGGIVGDGAPTASQPAAAPVSDKASAPKSSGSGKDRPGDAPADAPAPPPAPPPSAIRLGKPQ